MSKSNNKAAPLPHVSTGINSDAFSNQFTEFASTYDQVQVKNGSENFLFQRATGNVAPHADISAGGQLQVVPDAGAKYAAYTQSHPATSGKTPAWEKYAPWILGALGVLGLGGFLVFRKR